MEDKQKICDGLLVALQAMDKMSCLVDLEYIPEQEQVVATKGAEVKHINVAGYSSLWFAGRIMEVLFGLEER